MTLIISTETVLIVDSVAEVRGNYIDAVKTHDRPDALIAVAGNHHVGHGVITRWLDVGVATYVAGTTNTVGVVWHKGDGTRTHMMMDDNGQSVFLPVNRDERLILGSLQGYACSAMILGAAGLMDPRHILGAYHTLAQQPIGRGLRTYRFVDGNVVATATTADEFIMAMPTPALK